MFYTFRHFLFAFLLLTVSVPSIAQKSLQGTIDKYCRKECIQSQELINIADRVSLAYKLDSDAVLAIIHVESKYHIKAKNGSSIGLTQVLLRYHKGKFRGKNYYDIEDNVFAGMQVLRDCLKRTKGNYPRAFRCYNGGGDKHYVEKVMKTYKAMKTLDKPKPSADHLYDFLVKRKMV